MFSYIFKWSTVKCFFILECIYSVCFPTKRNLSLLFTLLWAGLSWVWKLSSGEAVKILCTYHLSAYSQGSGVHLKRSFWWYTGKHLNVSVGGSNHKCVLRCCSEIETIPLKCVQTGQQGSVGLWDGAVGKCYGRCSDCGWEWKPLLCKSSVILVEWGIFVLSRLSHDTVLQWHVQWHVLSCWLLLPVRSLHEFAPEKWALV